MRRPLWIGLLAVILAGTLVVALVGASEKRTLAFTLGVSPAQADALAPGSTICQTPIAVASSFDAVELQPGTYQQPGQPLTVAVRRVGGDGATIAQGTLPAGYPDVKRETVPVGHVPAGGNVAVCVTNAGSRRVAIYAEADAAARTSTALLDGRPTGSDLALVFRTPPRSTLALVPTVFQRLALFRGGWIGAWLYWVLLVAVVLGVPALLVRAFVGALRESEPDERPGGR